MLSWTQWGTTCLLMAAETPLVQEVTMTCLATTLSLAKIGISV